MSVAILLGFMWQAAFSAAMLRHYARHGSSFYLDNIAGAWPYVHQHLLWIGAFIALSTGQRGLARALAGAGAFLAIVQIISLADGGTATSEVVTAGGVVCFGLLPATALLMPGLASAIHRRLDWLCLGLILAAVVALFDDGVLPSGGMRTGVLSPGGMRIGPAGMNGVVSAVWVGWVACILALAWRGRHARGCRLAALVSTGHLLVVQLLWLGGEAVARLDGTASPLRTLVALHGVLRVLVLGGILTALLLLSRSKSSNTSVAA